MRVKITDPGTLLPVIVDAEVDAEEVATILGVIRGGPTYSEIRDTLDFKASANLPFHGPELLEGVAYWMDEYDDKRDRTGVVPVERTVQGDLRIWANAVRRLVERMEKVLS